jgi:hypothetical protein
METAGPFANKKSSITEKTMDALELLFLFLSAVVLYTYVGYGIILWTMVKIKQYKKEQIFAGEKSNHG